ncbi:hypothetical protein P4S72_29630 [Vibrio sp. PP-XX7]
MNKRSVVKKINAFIRYAILLIVGLMMLYPLLWMFAAAMKPNHEIFSSMSLIPSKISFEGFINGWKTGTEFTFGHYIINTFAYVIPKVILLLFHQRLLLMDLPGLTFHGKDSGLQHSLQQFCSLNQSY